MSVDRHAWKAVVVIAASLVGCEKEDAAPKPEPVKSAAALPVTPPPPPPPVATAAPVEPKHDCPEGSTGEGSFDKPCEATGAERTMEVAWNGKIGDSGPTFRVTNKSKLVILYGKIAIYFYDKAGKQIELPAGASGKPRQHLDCPGNIFGGVMNPGEKAVLTFSCLPRSKVPEGTDAIEAEMRSVGFADHDGKRTEFYWKNDDLAPDVRAKGGIKGAPKKKK